LIGNPSYNGAASTLSVASGAVTMNWGSLNQCIGSGGATFTATNTLNGGGNTGWSISPPADATVTPTAGMIAAMARGTCARTWYHEAKVIDGYGKHSTVMTGPFLLNPTLIPDNL